MGHKRVYTTLTRVKMALNGGVLPPMTALTAQATTLIDPSQTIGMGALMEDEEKGIKCPVRGCPVWAHNIGLHARVAHRAIGGAPAIRRALDIPPTQSLLSERAHAEFSQRARQSVRERQRGPRSPETRARMQERTHASRGIRSRAKMSMGARNMRDMCEAQMRKKFADFRSEYGRRPSELEFTRMCWREETGAPPWASQLIRDVYGSWENAVAQLDVVTAPVNAILTSEQAVACIRAWWDEWGELPSADDARLRDEFPLLPPQRVLLRALKSESWDEAMRRAASLLNIYGGRYGLPERNGAAS